MWINVFLFQVGWFVCVLERGLLALGATALILALHLYLHRQLRREWLLILVIAATGAAQDFVLIQLDVLRFGDSMLPPYWLICLWLLFATTLNHSLQWLQRRWLLAALLGAISGPLSYLAGERLGALEINHSLLPVLSLSWALCMPLLYAMLQQLKEQPSSCNAS